jgi:hypothetical protein
MFKPVQFSRDVEELVVFVEEADAETIVPATVDKLRAGVSPKALLTASALAVTRSTELPGDHHGGPIHPVMATYPVYFIHRMLSGEMAYLPLIQHTALCNLHIRSAEMGPYVLPEIQPADEPRGGVEGRKASLEQGMQNRQGVLVEKHLLGLLENATPGEALDVLLVKGLAMNHEDDHYFLYPSYVSRALDLVGWEYARYLLRPAARYLALPRPSILLRYQFIHEGPAFPAVEELLDRYKLLEIGIEERSSARETKAVGELADRIGNSDRYAVIPEMLAEALAGGLSLEGAVEAASVGASGIHVRTTYGNPMDVHLHTGINIRRYLLNVPGVSLRTKLLALLAWSTGPEIRSSEDKMEWSCRIDDETMAKLPTRDQAALIDAIAESIENQPEYDLSVIGNATGLMVAPPEVRETVALAQQYADAGHDAMPLFTRLAELACRDNFSEMHVFKFLQAIVEEYAICREPLRWIHLLSAAKASAVIYGKKQDVYDQAREFIAA